MKFHKGQIVVVPLQGVLHYARVTSVDEHGDGTAIFRLDGVRVMSATIMPEMVTEAFWSDTSKQRYGV